MKQKIKCTICEAHTSEYVNNKISTKNIDDKEEKKKRNYACKKKKYFY